MVEAANQRPGEPPLRVPPRGGGEDSADGFSHRQLLESLGLVVGGVAHDLNNALAVILGHAELAIDEAPQEGALGLRLRDIRESVVQAAALCRGLLACARSATPVRVGVDFAEVRSQVEAMFRGSVPGRIQMEWRVASDVPRLIGNPAHLRQILANLILNAVEAIGDDPGRIRIEIDSFPEGDSAGTEAKAVRIQVSDTGCGMDAQQVRGLFQPFHSTKAADRGLGLTAVRDLVERAGGTLRVSSHPGQGASFRLCFPVAGLSENSADPEGEDSSGDPPPWTGTETVLLVDDEPELLTVGSAMLAQAGLRVLTAVDGQEALERFQQNAGAIDLVFLDDAMPRMDGCEALMRMRQIDPGVRVVMVSGHPECELSRRWEGAPPDDILLKPVSPRQLKQALVRHLAPRESLLK